MGWEALVNVLTLPAHCGQVIPVLSGMTCYPALWCHQVIIMSLGLRQQRPMNV